MQKRIFLEKQTGYADVALRRFHELTEHKNMHGITEVRVLRCLLLDGWEEFPENEPERALYMDERTEVSIGEDEVRRLAAAEDTVCICILPLFRRPAEILLEQAIRFARYGCDPQADREPGTSAGVLCLRQAEVVLIRGVTEKDDGAALRRYLINPASETEIDLFSGAYGAVLPMPTQDALSDLILRGFRKMEPETLLAFARSARLGMSVEDLLFVQSYFTVEEKRDPTLLELRMIDTYWSDHCRHITFLTALQEARIGDPTVSASFETYLRVRESLYGARPKNITLMDLATVTAKYFRREDKLPRYLETGEGNAFTVRAGVRTVSEDGTETTVPWLLHFKNETHNYPTEKEPYLGAASSFGATVCDPLSARGTLLTALRLSGSADPLTAEDAEDGGRVPGLRICRESAEGFASFGAQCGIPVGLVREWMHPGFRARHMEVCMTAAAVPEADWYSRKPVPGDILLLVGAPTGRDGLGGALTASAAGDFYGRTAEADGVPLLSDAPKVYTAQVPDPGITRALIRLMRRRDVLRLTKRANDVGAGGIGVAAGEMAEGVRIDLDKVPAVTDRYGSGALNAWEIAASETQGRMLLTAASIHADALIAAAREEGLDARMIGVVTAERRFRMLWREHTVLSLSRDFIDATGAEKRIAANIAPTDPAHLFGDSGVSAGEDITRLFRRTLMHPEVRSQKPLSMQFDHTTGGRTVFLPFAGSRMLTPMDYTAVRMPVEEGCTTKTCAVFSYGCLPGLTERSPYHGAYLSVLQAICRMAAAGIPRSEVSLSVQEYFPSVNGDPDRYGVPLAAMLGVFQAQMDYETAAVGGKDSMSGTGDGGDVPPTVITFAVSAAEQETLCTPEFKKSGSRVYLLMPAADESGLPDKDDERGLLDYLAGLHAEHRLHACMAVGTGGVAAAVAQMCFGNHIGFNFEQQIPIRFLFEEHPGAFLAETDDVLRGILIGYTKDSANLFISDKTLSLEVLTDAWMKPQEKLYRTVTEREEDNIVAAFPNRRERVFRPGIVIPDPRVLLPVFPGVNGEDSMAARFSAAGFEVQRLIFRPESGQQLQESLCALARAMDEAQVLAFSGGSYASLYAMPDPAAAYVRALFGAPMLSEAMARFRGDGGKLLLGVGEGFSMLMAAGAFGDDRVIGGEEGLTLTEHPRGRIAAQMVRCRVMSTASPWMRFSGVGDICTLPAASRAGRCLIPDDTVLQLAESGQIAAQYVDADGNPTMSPEWNPFSSDFAVEGVFSRDGRAYGRTARCDCVDNSLCANIPGGREQDIFRAAAEYYRVR